MVSLIRISLLIRQLGGHQMFPDTVLLLFLTLYVMFLQSTPCIFVLASSPFISFFSLLFLAFPFFFGGSVCHLNPSTLVLFTLSWSSIKLIRLPVRAPQFWVYSHLGNSTFPLLFFASLLEAVARYGIRHGFGSYGMGGVPEGTGPI